MRVPVDWLGEHVEIPADVDGAAIAAALVRVGLEEEGLHTAGLTGPLVVGRIISAQAETASNGKTVHWCQVDVGEANGAGEPQGIVCGAPNVRRGDLVVVVLPGAVLPGDVVISARKTYGHVSAGMICAADELGLAGGDADGIIVLEQHLADQPEVLASLRPGQDAISLLGLDRETVEINVTPDRGYCFSLRGVAREYGHATGATFTDPALQLAERTPSTTAAQGHPVRLEDESPIRERPGCSRYVARVVRGVDVDAPTPAWMATRLTEAGMRPISLPVDITNYVMLDLGQPLHAFDLEGLGGPVVVRRARPGESLVTLDGVERQLDVEDLLITDGGATPIALAGVMGGAATEVGPQTTDLLIESAHFDPVTVARTARRHRLPSEASRRYERGVDPMLAPLAAQWAVELLVAHGGGVADDAVTDVGAPPVLPTITLDPDLPARLIGAPTTRAEVISTLEAVGCTVTSDGGGASAGADLLVVTPPSWRPDLTLPADLVEEVTRLTGYDRIPSILPSPSGAGGLDHALRVRRRVCDLLAAAGLHEVWSDPFVGDAQHIALGLDPQAERTRSRSIINPLSEERPLLRTRLLTTLLETVRRNVARGARDVALFECGLVTEAGSAQLVAPTVEVGVHPGAETLAAIHAAVPAQPRHLAFVLSGQRDRAGAWGPGRPAGVADVVDLARTIGEALSLEVSVQADEVAPFHPGRCARVELPGGVVVGHVGELHPSVLARLDLPERAVAGELDLDVLVGASGRPISARTLSTYPVARTDIALVVDEDVRAQDVAQALRDGAGEDLESLELFDVYRGDQVGEGRSSLAYRLTFRSAERTLTTDEVNAARDRAVAAAAARTGAVQR